MFFDTHAHYDDDAFDADREQLLTALPRSGVSLVINPGCTVSSSRAALALAERYPHVYAAAGIHPEALDDWTEGSIGAIRTLALRPKCAAIGEIGLDYYWDDSRRAEQKELFRVQLALAAELDLPVIVHDRDAHADSLEIVSEFPGVKGVFHCYSGSREMAEILLKMGWYLGFDGPVTYKSARKLPEVLSVCPLERILLETDSPYMPPVPFRGKRNDSTMLPYIAEKAAEYMGVSVQVLTDAAYANGKRLFGID